MYMVQDGGPGVLFQPLVEHVKVETLLALRDALTPDARVPRDVESYPAAAPNLGRVVNGAAAGPSGRPGESDDEDTVMDVDDEGLGLGSGSGPTSSGSVGSEPGWGGGVAADGRMMPPLTRPAPVLEDDEGEELGVAGETNLTEGNRAEGSVLPDASPGGAGGGGNRAGDAEAAAPGRTRPHVPASEGGAAGGGSQPGGSGGVPTTEGGMERAGERAARVLPAAFALAEACLEALGADSAAGEALADGEAAQDAPLPVLSQRCALCAASDDQFVGALLDVRLPDIWVRAWVLVPAVNVLREGAGGGRRLCSGPG